VDIVEILGFVSGALCVWLVARQNVWNWPIGIANNVMFLILFWTAGIYADAGLQIVYMGLALYGWWAWLRGGAEGTAGLTVLLDTVTDSTVPLPDAITTVLSLLATWGQARKKLESWWLWITADVIYIPLYAYKDLWLTAVLYVGFLALCVVGLRNWRAGYVTTPLAAAGSPASSATGQTKGSGPSATS
jgi:nicotinamide mononucleotide transporter